MTDWRALSDGAVSAAWAMSVDEALLSCVSGGSPVLRLYRFERPSISLGYRQPRPEWEERARAQGVDVVRRATGGGTVVHAGDLVYAFAAPLHWSGIPRSARGAYGFVRDCTARALLRLGVPVEPARVDPDAAKGSLCFAAATGSELALGDCKLLGAAQRRGRFGWLQHGSIRLRDDSRWYREILAVSPPAFADRLAELDVSRVERELILAFETELGCASKRGELRPEELREARLRESCRRDAPLGCAPFR